MVPSSEARNAATGAIVATRASCLMHTPNRRTPAGIKGMAEGGVMGAIGALAIAVNDALAQFNVRVERQPPAQQAIRELLRGANPPASSLPRKG
jgi:hypothetical protein